MQNDKNHKANGFAKYLVFAALGLVVAVAGFVVFQTTSGDSNGEAVGDSPDSESTATSEEDNSDQGQLEIVEDESLRIVVWMAVPDERIKRVVKMVMRKNAKNTPSCTKQI